ncbi:MAG: Kelch repeat-containing protein [Nitrospinales bacterium]
MLSFKRTCFFILFFFFTSFAGSGFASSKGFWKTMSPAPTPRTEATAAIIDHKIYLFGGFTPKGITNHVEVLDLKTGTWSKRQPMPKPLHHTSAVVAGGKIYVVGGFSSGMWTPVATNFEYDPVKDQWRKRKSMSTRRGALASGVIDGKIHAVSGAHKRFFRLVNTDAHEVYDPATDQWKTLEPIPTPRDHLTVSVVDGILYAIGGRVDVNYDENLDENEAYDPRTGQWTKRSPLPTARSGITSQVLSGKIYVFGGESGEGTFDENEAYDPGQNKWETMAPMPQSRHGLASAVDEGKIHVLTGGPNPGGGGSDFYEVFSLDGLGN